MKHLLISILLSLPPAAMAQTGNNYPVAFDKDASRTRTDRILNGISLDGVQVAVTNPQKMYNDMTHRSLTARPGQTVQPSFNYTGRWMGGFVYIDKNQNGQFDVVEPEAQVALTAENELVAFSGLTFSEGEFNSEGNKADMSSFETPAFVIPATLAPGFYMMRFKIDWDSTDPAGSMDPKNDIVSNGGGIVDVRLRLYSDAAVSIKATAEGGTLTLFDGTTLDGTTWAIGQELPLRVVPDAGHRLQYVSVRHGILTGDSLANGVAQYAEETFTPADVESGLLTIDGSVVDGDVELEAVFTTAGEDADDDEVYTLVFDDEFNQPDGSQPDPAKWQTSVRYGSTWNRYISPSPQVAQIRNGALVCRAMANPDRTTDDVPMITGAMETRDLFAFTYGKVEIRLRTLPHKGSFPAAWMMPQPPCESWPNAGEIDIFESIDAQNTAYHTVHSHWTYDLGYKNNPTSSFTSAVDIATWHVYGIVWDESSIRWTIDGKTAGTYRKSASQSILNRGQWPFDHNFYLILNQSVGDGSWAASPDTEFTYETEFDYVRVYQKVPTGIDTPPSPASPTGTQPAPVYDLQGRQVLPSQPASHTPTRLEKGIYISRGRKILVR